MATLHPERSRHVARLVVTALVAGACGGTPTTPDATPAVDAPDGNAPDGNATDGNAPDDNAPGGNMDATPDVALDAGAEATPDAAPDTGADVTPDAGADATPDATPDVVVDGGGSTRVAHLALNSHGHSCAALATGAVWCWGVNDFGQLGHAATATCTVPSADLPCDQRPRVVAGIPGASGVAGGSGGTCALGTDGAVWCWGTNDVAELGTGPSDILPHATPTRVTLPTARQVSSGAFHTCAVLMDGTVRCWGSNLYGEAGLAPASSPQMCDPGDGPVPCVTTPREVAGLTGVQQVAVGRYHTCALLAGGTVRCWGLNDSAQLGIGPADEISHPTPTAVAVTNVTQVAAGGSHTCAVRSDGSLWCWGWNGYGQLGIMASVVCTASGGDFACEPTPTAVPGLTAVRQVAAGRYHSCVVTTAGAVRCFGRNDDGQIGLGTTTGDSCSSGANTVTCIRTPMAVTVGAATEVAVGDYHSCAVLADGTARCWGWNAYGQLGDGTTTDHASPVAVAGLP